MEDWKQQRDKYMTERVVDQIDWYSRKSGINKRWFYTSRITIIISGALISFLISFSQGDLEWLKYLAAGLGVIISIAEGIMSLKKYRENWAIYRETGENLKRERYLYENHVGDNYGSGDEAAFKQFVVRIEQITASENREWTNVLNTIQAAPAAFVLPTPPPPAPPVDTPAPVAAPIETPASAETPAPVETTEPQEDSTSETPGEEDASKEG